MAILNALTKDFGLKDFGLKDLTQQMAALDCTDETLKNMWLVIASSVQHLCRLSPKGGCCLQSSLRTSLLPVPSSSKGINLLLINPAIFVLHLEEHTC